MKPAFITLVRALALCAFVVTVATGPSVFGQSQIPDLNKRQEPEASKDKDKSGQMSDAERQAIQKINNASTATAKLEAAGEFLKKYPKSSRRAEVARHVVAEISRTQDAAQQVTLSESYLTVFTDASDADIINPILIDAYVRTTRPDDAFRVTAKHLEKNPNDVIVLTEMALVGTEQLKARNPKYAQQTQQYGSKAIELIEAGKKPDTMEPAQWEEYRTKWLPALYQSVGLISLVTGNKADARVKLEKSASLNSTDPVTFMLLGTIINDEYEKLAEQHKSMLPGADQDRVLKEAQAKMDEVIELYARTVGLAQGDPRYQPLQDQVMQDLQAYYKYRHKGSTDGLQQLIDKYKKPATQK